MAASCCFPCVTQQLYTECEGGKYTDRRRQKRMEEILEQQVARTSPMPNMAPALASPAVYAYATQPVAVAVATKDEATAPPKAAL